MTSLATDLLASAAAVVKLGSCPADIASLDDAQLETFQRAVGELQSCVKTFAALGAGEIARRSSFEAGYSGFSRSGGHATPEQRIQSLTGVKLDEAREAVRVGQMNIAHENAAAAAEELGIDLATATADDIAELSEQPGFAELAGPDTIWQAPIVDAINHGTLDASAADAIRRGLGVVDDSITPEQLRDLATRMVTAVQREAANRTPLTPEQILKQARQLRTSIDKAAIERGAKTRQSLRSLKIWQNDDMLHGHFRIPMESGGADIERFFNEVISPRIGGPRFTSPDDKVVAQLIIDDPRSNEQILADELVDLVQFPTRAIAPVTPITRRTGASPYATPVTPVDPTPGDTVTTPVATARPRRRSVVAIIVERQAPTGPTGIARGADPTPYFAPDIAPNATPDVTPGIAPNATPDIAPDIRPDVTPGITPDVAPDVSLGVPTDLSRDPRCYTAATGAPLPIEVADRAMCTDDIVDVEVTTHGHLLTLGRTRRLFSDNQRLALGIQWGGCAIGGCTKPAEFTEAHHIKQWKRDNGHSNTSNGICLCRFHHMMIHDAHWDITTDGCLYWLIPPRTIDTTQTPIALFSKNPTIRAKQERALHDHTHNHDTHQAHPDTG